MRFGMSQLERIDTIIEKRRKNAKWLAERLVFRSTKNRFINYSQFDYLKKRFLKLKKNLTGVDWKVYSQPCPLNKFLQTPRLFGGLSARHGKNIQRGDNSADVS